MTRAISFLNCESNFKRKLEIAVDFKHFHPVASLNKFDVILSSSTQKRRVQSLTGLSALFVKQTVESVR